jgi:pimeloyl-ACP methyl ester carboxylesterase
MSDGSAGTFVLVHGGFVDGSGWQGVYHRLTEDGYSVSVVQNPTISLAGDADATRRVIDAQSEPVILVGHSYGGAVISEAGTDPNVKALVYIAAFMPDAGESVQTLIADLPPKTGPPILPAQDGFLLLDRAKFHEAFACDVDAELAEFIGHTRASDRPAGCLRRDRCRLLAHHVGRGGDVPRGGRRGPRRSLGRLLARGESAPAGNHCVIVGRLEARHVVS